MTQEDINGRLHLTADAGMKITTADENDFYSEVYLGINETVDAYKEVTDAYIESKVKAVVANGD
jgi:hypothetical protein